MIDVREQDIRPILTGIKRTRRNHKGRNPKLLGMGKSIGGVIGANRNDFCAKEWIFCGLKKGSKV